MNLNEITINKSVKGPKKYKCTFRTVSTTYIISAAIYQFI